MPIVRQPAQRASARQLCRPCWSGAAQYAIDQVGDEAEVVQRCAVNTEHRTAIELAAATAGHGDRPSTPSLGDSLILAISERLGYKVLTRDTYWTWMVDEKLSDGGVMVP